MDVNNLNFRYLLEWVTKLYMAAITVALFQLQSTVYIPYSVFIETYSRELRVNYWTCKATGECSDVELILF